MPSHKLRRAYFLLDGFVYELAADAADDEVRLSVSSWRRGEHRNTRRVMYESSPGGSTSEYVAGLEKTGDALQSAASRCAEWIIDQHGRVPYEVYMAALEARSAVEEWTDVRREATPR